MQIKTLPTFLTLAALSVGFISTASANEIKQTATFEINNHIGKVFVGNVTVEQTQCLRGSSE